MIIRILLKWTGILGIVITVIGLLRWLMTLKSEPDEYDRLRWKIEITVGIAISCISFFIRSFIPF